MLDRAIRTRIMMMCAVILSIAGGMSQGAAAADAAGVSKSASKDRTLIVYGGLGYAKENAQPQLYEILSAAFETDYTIETIVDRVSVGVDRVNKRGGFSTLSSYPVAVTRDDAEAAMRLVSNQSELPRDAIATFEQYFDRVLGLVLVSSYEDRLTRVIQDPNPARSSDVYHDFFTAGVSAMLVDLATNEIVTSASAIGRSDREGEAQPLTSSREINAHFQAAYENAAGLALERLQAIANRHSAKSISRRGFSHIVTGMWVSTPNTREIFGWRKPKPAENYCTIPNGCPPGAKNCQQLASLLVHGLTSVLSEQGLSAVPPLNLHDWTLETAYDVGLRLHAPSQERGTLLGNLLRVSIQPQSAEVKNIIFLDNVSMKKTPAATGGVISDDYYAFLSIRQGETFKNSCELRKAARKINDDDFYGLISDPRHVSQPSASPDAQLDYYKFAILEALPKLQRKIQ